MEHWLSRIGYGLEWLGGSLRQAVESAADTLAHGAEEVEDAITPDGDASPLQAAAALLSGGAGAWIAGRFLRPAEVAWSRAVLAGVIGTLLYDATMAVDQRVLGRKFDTILPLGEAVTDDPDLQPWVAWTAHYAAGVGLALFYARFLHERIPGPRVVRGAAFGIVDAATLQWGGLLPLLAHTTSVPLPTGYRGLAAAPEFTIQSLLRHAAYGIGVGLVYDTKD